MDYYIYAENVSSDIVVSDTYRFVVGQVSILFDYTREETAGNADWVIDNNMPYPSPSNPTSETSWLGAISSWAFELYQAGYNVVTLPPDSAITYGTTHPLDLSNFDVYVICEPQNPFSYQEEKAIYDFARNGGGFSSFPIITERIETATDGMPRKFSMPWELTIVWEFILTRKTKVITTLPKIRTIMITVTVQIRYFTDHSGILRKRYATITEPQ